MHKFGSLERSVQGPYIRWQLKTHFARVKKDFIEEQKIKFATAVDLTKCFQQITLPILIYTCAANSKLPSDISTMEVYESYCFNENKNPIIQNEKYKWNKVSSSG